ncbi:MAG: AAA family ATPase [Candidatus Taylorbacteria bacterium]|nr:AAA family ATPase [Candidatus Taylorbacteria bacterium]
MYLKSLELSGFKSFAKKSSLEFSSPITGIVGPNGSGKSNVAEAFRFVLGEQSIKSLRGKRGEDLIWNGSGELTKGNRASVKVTFNNIQRIFPLDFDEISIERVVHRDSSNEYLINGTPVRLKDVVELLASAHIGSSGHHIISQGEADRILSANIRERREMIEDALGLKIYQYKKSESLRKLEKTEENISQVESLRREIAPHLKFLKKQVEKIQRARELRDALRLAYKEYFAREKAYLNSEKEKITAEIAGPKAEFEKLTSDLEKVKKIMAESSKQNEKGSQLINTEAKLRLVLDEKEKMNREAGRIDGEISSIERFIKREEDKQKSDSEKLIYFREVEKFVKEIQIDIDQSENIKNSEPATDASFLRDLIKKIKDSCFKFLSANTAVRDTSAVDEAKKDITNLEQNKITISQKLKEVSENEDTLRSEYKAVQSEIEKEKDTNRDAEREIFRIVARQNDVRSTLDSIRFRESKLKQDEVLFEQDIHDAYALVGREAVDYESVNILTPEGAVINPAEFIKEPREKQQNRKHEIERTKIRLEEAGGAGGAEVEKEFLETTERDAFLARELEDLHKSSESLKQLIAELDARLNLEFKDGVLKINSEFQRLFELMFGGGSAGLNVVREKKRTRSLTSLNLSEDGSVPDSLDGSESEEETQEGIDISVSLPRKKIKGLMMLSGGERALTSIALLFAISQVKPPPFIILDETDAALDEANSRKYGDMVSGLAERSQLILITHNRETMSRAGVLYGVTMGREGASKLLSIKFEEALAVAK